MHTLGVTGVPPDTLFTRKASMNAEMKPQYNAPVLVTLGSADQLTQNVNVLGGGDTVFDTLNPS